MMLQIKISYIKMNLQAFENLIWNVQTPNIQMLDPKSDEIVALSKAKITQLTKPLTYTLPLVLYFDIYLPDLAQQHRYYNMAGLSAYDILGAIQTFVL